MSSAEITNILIFMVLGLISYVSKRMIDKMDSFEKTVQDILMSDIATKKDIEQHGKTLENHEERITKLEQT
ncbi:hypothetical protein UFOVP579_52 [uncultured Caudovirales phage]|uniref:Uncharacterized protein n=1 Tax=uncultured Caudovirales phage TaxID=2100421 RepID=A0A6J5LT33_9CAUD|nr:hypothetical protein UFOVP302_52 [uncultured Caudovirales phage]CAB4168765.1 hypothetical protein UFOVP579_52 [uncultured Caudovirales phage]